MKPKKRRRRTSKRPPSRSAINQLARGQVNALNRASHKVANIADDLKKTKVDAKLQRKSSAQQFKQQNKAAKAARKHELKKIDAQNRFKLEAGRMAGVTAQTGQQTAVTMNQEDEVTKRTAMQLEAEKARAQYSGLISGEGGTQDTETKTSTESTPQYGTDGNGLI